MKKILLGLLSLSFVLSVFFIGGTTAYAAGEYYNGTDPISTGCANDARTIDTDTVYGNGTTIYLRYSPSCRTAWAKIVTPYAVNTSTTKATATIIRDNGFEGDWLEYSCNVPNGQTSCYTRQVNDAGYVSSAYGEYRTASGTLLGSGQTIFY